MSRGIIALDFDGTLVDCKPKQLACLRDAALRLSVTIDESLIWRRKRQGCGNVAAFSGTDLDHQTILQIQSFWLSEIESEYYIRYDKLHEDAIETIQRLYQIVRLCVVSARSNSKRLIKQIKNLGISRFLSDVHIVNPADVVPQKAKILSEIGSLCYVGDTEHDVAAARAAEMPSYIVCNGQRDAEFLKQFEPARVYANLSSVGEVLINVYR